MSNFYEKITRQIEQMNYDLQKVNEQNNDGIKRKDLFSSYLTSMQIFHMIYSMYIIRIYISPTSYFSFYFGYDNEYVVIERINNNMQIGKDIVLNKEEDLREWVITFFIQYELKSIDIRQNFEIFRTTRHI